MKKNKHDSIYAQDQSEIKDFVFDSAVTEVFSDMIERSVPGYRLSLEMIGVLTHRYAQKNSSCYDLGSSLGAGTLAMRHAIKEPNCQVIAIDNSPAMVAQCQKNLAHDSSPVPVEVICQNIECSEIISASVVVLNFTLQFIQREKRGELLRKIYEGMKPGGVLIISEKITFSKADEQEKQTDWYHDFKKAHGYSDLEISQKRVALENVLQPDSWEEHQERVFQAGFSHCYKWFQCFSFVSFIAEK